MAATFVVNLSGFIVADEGFGIEEVDGRLLRKSRAIGFCALSRASDEGELAMGQVVHVVLAFAVAWLIIGSVGRILYAAGLKALRARAFCCTGVIGIMVVPCVSIAISWSGTVSSRAGRLFVGGSRTIRAFYHLAVTTIGDDRRELRPFGASIQVQLLTPASTTFVLGQTFASVRSPCFVVGLPGACALVVNIEMRSRATSRGITKDAASRRPGERMRLLQAGQIIFEGDRPLDMGLLFAFIQFFPQHLPEGIEGEGIRGGDKEGEGE